jgi:hypothetical protein
MRINRPSFPVKGCGIRGAKKARHQRKGSSTSGREKTLSCKADWRRRGACRVARSYRWPEYQRTMNIIDKQSMDKSQTARARVLAFAAQQREEA